MYESSKKVVRCAVGETYGFKVEVGLHWAFLFAMVIDRLMDEIKQEFLLTMMFADDNVIGGDSTEQVAGNLERWRCALEKRGMRVNRTKTFPTQLHLRHPDV